MIVPYSTDKSDNFIGYGAVGILVACVVGFLLTWPAQRSLDARLATDSLRVWTEVRAQRTEALVQQAESGARQSDEQEEGRPPDMGEILKDQVMPKATPADLSRRMHEVQVRESPLFRFGFDPAEGRWFPGILVHQFLHSGVLHLLGNLIFFFAFGVAIERRWGIERFLAFYLVAGAVAALCQVGSWSAFHGGRLPPSTLVGASGSIAAVMGAFLRVYPASRVKVFVWLFRPRLGQIPAWIFLGFWVALEFLRGWLLSARDDSGGTAYMAHVGGFAFGFLTAPLIPLSDEVREELLEERRERPQGVSISTGSPVAVPAPPPAAEVAAKPWIDQAFEALADGRTEEAKGWFQRQLQSWLRGGGFEHDSIADLVVRLERDHAGLGLDPLVLWECGMKLQAEPRNAEAARICLRKVAGPGSTLPESLRTRAEAVLGDLERRALPPGLEAPLQLPGTAATRSTAPGAGGWRVD